MSLRDTHQQFITAMYQSSMAAEKFIKPSTILSANERLAIYRGSVRGGLLQALGDIYPVLKQLLGDHAFEGLSRRYIEQHRSSSANIADYGDNFSEFIRFFEPLSEYPYMADVALLEWAWHQVFNEADSGLLNLEQLSRLTPDQHLTLKFSRPKASRLIQSPWPIKTIWSANQISNSDQESIKLIQQNNFLLVWRNGYEMRIDNLSETQWGFLNAIDQTTHFSDAIEQFLASYPNGNVSELFSSAITQGWITEFEQR